MFRKYRCYLSNDSVRKVAEMTLRQIVAALFDGYAVEIIR